MKLRTFLFAAFVSMMTVFAVGCSDDDNNNVKPGGDNGEDPVPPVTEDVMVMQDGFLAADGLDEASGRYRLTIMLCSQKIGSQTFPYYDVMLYLYLKEPMTPIDEHRQQVPFGRVTPFFVDGQMLGDMVYYIGKHKMDGGEESFEGTAWAYNKSETDAEFFVANDLERTEIYIDDNGDGSYTVRGTLYDKDLNKEMKFKYVDTKPVYVLATDY